uniref:Uncharacterized protein n=1 Tax=Caenorhabditis japonica TaxID=281687 RepID=A0A8R1II09_CAEJA
MIGPPEILVEPALHGRFRKRLAAVRAGKTTITKPPSKKRKPAKTVEESTSKNGNGATTIKAIVVPSVDASPEHCGPSTSAETLSQPLSVLTNDNTNSMGPSPLVSGVQTPTEAFLSQQLDFMQRPVDMEMSTLTNCPLSLEDPQAIAQYNTATYLPSYDGQNSYSRSCANNDPLPLNILEGEDDYLEEEKQRKLATERGKTEHNELGMYFADPMLSSGVAVPDLSFNALTGTSGPHDNLLKSNDDPFLSGNVRNKPPRGLFDLDDEEFDIDKDVIDLSGSDNTRPSTPSVGIIDDHSYGCVYF